MLKNPPKNVSYEIVAPGAHILSTGLPTGDDRGGYLFLSGTSASAALITGFMALVLSEFKENFSREQILKVCYASTSFFDDTQECKESSYFGALDLRTALFVLHVLTSIKTEAGEYCSKKFNNCVKTVLLLLKQRPEKNDIRLEKITLNDAIRLHAELVIHLIKKRKKGSFLMNIFPQNFIQELHTIVHGPKIDLFEHLPSDKKKIIEAIMTMK